MNNRYSIVVWLALQMHGNIGIAKYEWLIEKNKKELMFHKRLSKLSQNLQQRMSQYSKLLFCVSHSTCNNYNING